MLWNIITTGSLSIPEKMDSLGLNKTDDSFNQIQIRDELQLQVNTEIKMKGRPDCAVSDLSRTNGNGMAFHYNDPQFNAGPERCGVLAPSSLAWNGGNIVLIECPLFEVSHRCQQSFVDTQMAGRSSHLLN